MERIKYRYFMVGRSVKKIHVEKMPENNKFSQYVKCFKELGILSFVSSGTINQ
jgi:hypothetical protein